MKIIISGVFGKMGHHLTEAIKRYPDMTVIAGIDNKIPDDCSFPVYSSWSDVTETADVIIDFSHHSAVDALLEYIEFTKTPAVICTTGLSELQVQRIHTISNQTAILRSGNMSLGINLLMDLISKASELLYEHYDIEIIEKHHKHKVDAPSGTAFMLAEAAKNAIPEQREFTYGRHGNDCPRHKSEIGIHAVRGGSIVGDHSVIFAGPDEIIELNHIALSRGIFATGAVRAARFLPTQDAGLYTMKDVLK